MVTCYIIEKWSKFMRVVIFLLFLFSFSSFAEPINAKLECNGKLHIKKSNETLDLSGIYVEISDTNVKINSIPYFRNDFIVNKINETQINFTSMHSNLVWGIANRMTGTLLLIETDSSKSVEKNIASFVATCKNAKQLF
jgi:hypothetical protein